MIHFFWTEDKPNTRLTPCLVCLAPSSQCVLWLLIPVEKRPRTKSCLDVAMTVVMRRKETLGVDTVLPEHVCQAESGCVMSCNLTMQAEFIQRTLRWCLTHRQQNDARALNSGLTCTAVKPTRSLGHRALTIQRKREGAPRT